MKIAWICPLETNLYSDRYKLPETRVLAPWITALIREFQKRADIELHIVTPLSKIAKGVDFSENGVHFHLLPSGVPLLGKPFPPWAPFHLLTGYRGLRRKIKGILDRIRPDIVHLHGTENNYSPAILDVTVPSVVSIQGLAHNRKDSGMRSWRIEKAVRLEAEIFRTQSHFIVRLPSMENLIREYNPGAKIFHSNYPLNPDVFEFRQESGPEVDIIYAARITPEKGIEDLLAALEIAKREWRPLSAQLIGSCASEYRSYLANKISQAGLENEVRFVGYLKVQRDVFRHMKNSKIFVLPTHFDITPGSLLESMALGVPVIAYDVGGLSTLIESGKNGLLVPRGDVRALVRVIIELLDDQGKRDRFASAARQTADRFRVEPIANETVRIYNEILHR